MSSPRPIIYGTVPGTTVLPPLPDGIRVSDEPSEPAEKTEKPKRKVPARAWRKGYPPGTTKEDIASGRAVKAPSARPPARIPAVGKATQAAFGLTCVGCSLSVLPLDLPTLRELVRVARDRLAHGDGDGRTDLLFLAARLDGYCSLGCWRDHAPETLVESLDAWRAIASERKP